MDYDELMHCSIDSDELYHYGVKGMKWGVRHDYEPVGRKRAASDEASDRRSSSRSSSGSSSNPKSSRTNNQNQNQNQTQNNNSDHSKLKTALKVGAAVAGTALVSYGAYRLVKSGKVGKLITAGKSYLSKNNLVSNKKATNVMGLPDLGSTAKSIGEVIKGVNPTKSTTNCRSCAVSGALRLKGINAEALDISGGGFNDVINKCFSGAKHAEMYDASKDKITKYISKKYTDGDYGVISSGFTMPNGKSFEHAYNWKIENGTIKFFDGQSEIADFSTYLDFVNSRVSTEIYGLTNAEPILENLQQYVKLR